MHYALLSQVPDLDSVVVASSCHLVAVWKEVDGDNLAYVSWELKDVLATSQVPHKPSAV